VIEGSLFDFELSEEEMEVPTADIQEDNKKIITHDSPLKKEAQKVF